MRRFLAGLLGACLSAVVVAAEQKSAPTEEKAPSIEQTLGLEGKALFEAAHKIPYSELSPTDVLKLTEKLAAELKSARHDDDRYLFGSFFEEACHKAGPREIDKVAAIYARFPPDSFEKEWLFEHLAAAWINRELAAIRSEQPSIKLPTLDTSLPAELKDAPAALASAYRAFKRAMHPLEKAFPVEDSMEFISYQHNQKSFFALIEKVLSGPEKGLAEKLRPYAWSGGCGMGAPSVEGPQTLAILMCLLRERKLAEAVGAVLSIPEPTVTGGGCELLLAGNDKIDMRIEFLKVCGLDWEELLAGAELALESRENFSGFWSPFLCRLAALGSDHAASLVAEMARRAKPDTRKLYVQAIGALLEQAGESKEGVVTFSSSDIDRIATAPISIETRKKLLRILQDFSKRDVPNDLATDLLSALDRAHDRDTIPALRSLLHHFSPDVVTVASRLLRGLGEEVNVAIKNDPIRFRILVDGKPLPAGSDINWSVAGASSGAKVDEQGIIGIERARFLDPERKPGKVFLERNESDSRPWFVGTVPITTDLDTVRSMNVATGSLELTVRKAKRPFGPGDLAASLEIQRAKQEEGTLFGSSPAKLSAPLGQPMVIDGLQTGAYKLSVHVPGHERWRQTIEVKPEKQSIEVRLKPGSDVHVKILPAHDTRDRYTVLLNNGREMESCYTDETDTYRGLPVGNYVLHIPSAEDIRSIGVPGEDNLGPDEIDYVARDVAFVISDNSPALVDLGEISLQAAKK